MRRTISVPEIQIEPLCHYVRSAHLEPDGRYAASKKTLFDLVHQSPAVSVTAMFGGNPESNNMARAVRLDHPYDKGDHLIARSDDLMANRLGMRKKIAYGLAVVGFAVREATLVEPPTLVKIAVAHRHHNGLGGRSHHRLNQILLFSPPRPHFYAYATTEPGYCLNSNLIVTSIVLVKSHSLYANE